MTDIPAVSPVPVPDAVPPVVPTPTPAPTPAYATGQRAALAVGVAAFLLVALVVNIMFSSRFPGNAPVEQIYAFGISVDLAVAGILLLILAPRMRRRSTLGEPRPAGVGAMALTAIILSGVTWIFGLFAGLGHMLSSLVGLTDFRYMTDAGAGFFLGVPWVLGIIFGVLSYRTGGGTANTVTSLGAVGLGLLFTIPTVTSAVIYGLGLSN